MASATAAKMMMEEALCSICLELMTEPVSIDCGHSFCRRCTESILENLQLTSSLTEPQCPLCRTPFQRESLRPNKHLENLIQMVKQLELERLCEEHGEQLHLFCEDDGQLICWRCERSPRHRGHSTELVQDAGPGYREKLRKSVTNLRFLESRCQGMKLTVRAQMSKWKEKVNVQKQNIQSDFKNLYKFLCEEEKAFLWRLKKEEEETLRSLKDHEASLKQQIQELQSHILELEKKCQDSDQDLLQDVKDTLSRSLAVKLELGEEISIEPNTVCDVSELYLNVKKMLKSYQVSVTLDPDSAHEDLAVSENWRRVTCEGPQMRPKTSERFSMFPCVLGCESFTLGRYYFEVDVGEGTGCVIGVCLQNVSRSLFKRLNPESGFWVMRMCKTNGCMALTAPITSLHLSQQPQVVGVFLDCEAGLVSFYNMAAGSHIYTFPRASFSDALRPFFCIYQHSPLLLPLPEE
ncbi:PREDICTED: E3 ubiquitin-protein ligase TRIM38 [Condylura cristata]|uniref:E3 ubiquitin-protein ligase TRIM38 n=1 Tax=Condylura cristata TaxID=143302 RepID=UPI0003343272|nr:PREDICTED: E3 ubiquitin-protein ligase TRIM38 [Condylura cristata]